MITRPLLAETLVDLNELDFKNGYLFSYKLDGIRALKINGQLVSRKFKPIPNKHIRMILEAVLPDNIDGEILCPGKSFNETQSLVMSEEGEPEFMFYAFDYVLDLKKAFEERVKDLNSLNLKSPYFSILEQVELLSIDEALKFEEEALSKNFEGVMIRKKSGPYKCGRSTKKEEILLKLKRFLDAEGLIIGFEERMHNENEKETNELGLTKRAFKKENLIPAETLGALLVKDIKTNLEFKIGTGFDDALRKKIWDNKEQYLGKLLTYKYQPSGMKERPRFPVFLGFRHEDDL